MTHSVVDSIGDFFLNFGSDFKDIVVHPLPIINSYSMASIFIIAIYPVSKLITDGLYILHNKIMSATLTNTRRRGFFVLHVIFLLIIFTFDFYKFCDEKELIRIQLSQALKEFLLLVAPVYLLMIAIQNFSPYKKLRRTVPNTPFSLIEGVVMFLFYNWGLNFRKHNEYILCQDRTAADIANEEIEKAVEEETKQPEFRFDDHKYYDDPSKRAVETKIERTITTSSSDSTLVDPQVQYIDHKKQVQKETDIRAKRGAITRINS